MENQQLVITGAVGAIVGLILGIGGSWIFAAGGNDSPQLQQLQQELNRKNQRIEQLREENQTIQTQLDQAVKGGETSTEDQSVVLRLPNRVLFELGSAYLSREGKTALRSAAEVLGEHPDRTIRVEGHADTLPITTPRYPSNWELSSHRATNVLRFLVDDQGIGRRRITAVGYGEYHPLVPNNSPENRAKNRRVEIALHPPELPSRTLDN